MNAAALGGSTPLLWAVRHGREDVANWLLANGACINAQDDQGRSALFWATTGGKIDVVKMLVANNADSFLRDKEGMG